MSVDGEAKDGSDEIVVDISLPKTVSLPQLLDEGERDDSFRKMVGLLVTFEAQSSRVRNAEAVLLQRKYGIDLAASEVSFLWAVVKTYSGDRGSTHRRIAQYLQVTKAAISAMSISLDQKGFIRKVADPMDRRRQLIFLTRKGEEALRVSALEQRKINDVEFSSLSHDDVVFVSTVVQRLLRDGERVLSDGLDDYL